MRAHTLLTLVEALATGYNPNQSLGYLLSFSNYLLTTVSL